MKKGAIWPWLIGGALAAGAALDITMICIASGNPSLAVEDDYYEKGLDWDRSRMVGEDDTGRIWSLALELDESTDASRATQVHARIADRDGRAIDGAAVEMVAFHDAHPLDKVKLRLTPSGAGHYKTDLAVKRGGRWTMRFAVAREETEMVFERTRWMETSR